MPQELAGDPGAMEAVWDALARQTAGVIGGVILLLLAWHADYTVLLRRRWAAPLALAGITAASLCCLFFSSVDYTGRLYPSTPVYFTLLQMCIRDRLHLEGGFPAGTGQLAV